MSLAILRKSFLIFFITSSAAFSPASLASFGGSPGLRGRFFRRFYAG